MLNNPTSEAINNLVANLKQFKWNKKGLSGTSLCPFHQDSHPSFGVSFALNSFHCFSCHASGNINKLCEHFNIDKCFSSKTNKKTAGFKKLKGILKQEYKTTTQEGAYNIISNKKDAITNPSLNTKRFLYSHPYLDLRIMEDSLKDKFICRYDTETESIIFPIHDLNGLIVGNYRRFNEKKSKLKSKGKFSKGFQISSSLYNLNNYCGQKTVLITEGIIDCITTYGNLKEEKLDEYILPISCYSITNLNKKHLRMLKKLGIENIILFFDNDKAGLLGIESFKKDVWNISRNKFISCYVPDFDLYPKNIKDPDDLLPEQTKLLLENLREL